MRKPEYLSPTSIDLFYQDRDEFYRRYLSDHRQSRMKQTNPMAVGSAFDTYVKCDLYQKLHGTVPPEWEFETIFEKQVEPQCRDWAREHGNFVFHKYKQCGALADLMLELEQAIGDPKFELEIKGFVYGETVAGVPLLGKPDLYFQNKEGKVVIIDWKVNGYCSNYNTSPAKGYLWLKGDREKGPHKDCVIGQQGGLLINTFHYLEDVDEKWANQVAVYGWLCGEEIGNEFIAGIDQIVCNPIGGEYPLISVAKHRLRVSHHHQVDLWNKITTMWSAIENNHIFSDLPIDESQDRGDMLDEEIKMMIEDPTFAMVTRT